MIDNVQLIIDAGHGGKESGATAFNVLEKDLNLTYAKLVAEKLNKYFSNVLMTRDSDITIDLTSRAKWVAEKANSFDGKTICLSCHLNAFNGTARGCETIYSIHSNNELAKLIGDKISELGIPMRRVFSRKSDKGDYDYYGMHRNTGKAQTVIIEPLFIDNTDDFKILESADFMDRLSYKIVEGVLEYLGIVKKEDIIEVSSVDYKKKYEELKVKGKVFADAKNKKYQELLNKYNDMDSSYVKLFNDYNYLVDSYNKIKLSWGYSLQLLIEKILKKNK